MEWLMSAETYRMIVIGSFCFAGLILVGAFFKEATYGKLGQEEAGITRSLAAACVSARASASAAVLSPSFSRTSGDGPTKTIPASASEPMKPPANESPAPVGPRPRDVLGAVSREGEPGASPPR